MLGVSNSSRQITGDDGSDGSEIVPEVGFGCEKTDATK